jgi:hypothetical protein
VFTLRKPTDSAFRLAVKGAMLEAALPVESQELVKSRMGTTGIRLQWTKPSRPSAEHLRNPWSASHLISRSRLNGTNNDDFNPDDGSNSLDSSDGAKRARYSTSAYSPKHSIPAKIRSAKLLTVAPSERQRAMDRNNSNSTPNLMELVSQTIIQPDSSAIVTTSSS